MMNTMIDQLNEQYDNLISDLHYFTSNREHARAIETLDELQAVYLQIKSNETELVDQPF